MDSDLVKHEILLKQKLYNKFDYFTNIIFDYQEIPILVNTKFNYDMIKQNPEVCTSDFMFIDNVYNYNYILKIYNYNNNNLELKFNKEKIFEKLDKHNKIDLLQKIIDDLSFS